MADGLFGPSPWDVQQAQNASLSNGAMRYAQLSPMDRAAAGMYQAGGLLGGVAADALGGVNVHVQQAQNVADIQKNIDHTTPDGLMQGATLLKDTNPALAAQYVQAAQAMKAQQADAAYKNAQANKINAQALDDMQSAGMKNLPPAVQAILKLSKISPDDPGYESLKKWVDTNANKEDVKDAASVTEFKFAQSPQGGNFEGTYTDWLKSKTQATHITVSSPSGGGTYGLTPEEDQAINSAIVSGKLDPTRVTSRSAKYIARQFLLNPDTNMVSASADSRAITSALGKNTVAIATIEPFANMLDQNVVILKGLADKAVKTNSVLGNKTLNWLYQNMGDNPDTADMLAQMRFVQTEAARVLNNPNLTGQLTDSARHEMESVINGNMPLNSMNRVLDRVLNDSHRRLTELKITNSNLRRGVSYSNPPQTNIIPVQPNGASISPTPTAPKVSTGWGKAVKVSP